MEKDELQKSDIEQIAKETFNSMLHDTQYKVGPVPYHTHNGVDSFLITTSSTPAYSIAYPGIVGSGGTSVLLPTGWTSAKQATGDYLITHNLGTTDYAVSSIIWNSSQATVFIADQQANTLNLYIKTTADAFADHQFSFTITILN